jgi:hypothetical protein
MALANRTAGRLQAILRPYASLSVTHSSVNGRYSSVAACYANVDGTSEKLAGTYAWVNGMHEKLPGYLCMRERHA